MFCPSCGTESLPDHKFCKSCGVPLRAAGDAQGVPPAAATPTPQAVAPPVPVAYTPAQVPPPYTPTAAAPSSYAATPIPYVPPPAAGYPPPPIYAPYPPMAPAPKKSPLRSILMALVVLIGLGSAALYYIQNGRKVTIGTKDEVFYSGTATKDQATALGNALKTDGYFQDKGVTVLLDKGSSGTTISFIVKDGFWDQAGTLSGFEEIGRTVAPTVGGLPVQIDLDNTTKVVEKTSTVGEASFDGGDAVFYEGSATLAQAQAVGQKLKSDGFFEGKGANVFVVKHDSATTVVMFVVGDDAWDNPQMVSDFEVLARDVAPAAGGLPVDMQLVTSDLTVKKDETLN
jgi:hypothetical protein